MQVRGFHRILKRMYSQSDLRQSWRSLLSKVTLSGMWKKGLEISCRDPTPKGLAALQVKNDGFTVSSVLVRSGWSLAKLWSRYLCYLIFRTLVMPALGPSLCISCPFLTIPRQSIHDISAPPHSINRSQEHDLSRECPVSPEWIFLVGITVHSNVLFHFSLLPCIIRGTWPCKV